MTNAEISDPSRCIAIVGMSGRFPGARNIDEFWRNLRDGVESITFSSDEELEAAGIEPAILRRPDYVKAKGILDDVDLFDAAFFGLSPREAEITDPQHRLFLECAWEVLESAGYDAESYEGSIAVYGGVSLNTYLLTNLQSNRDLIESVGLLQTSIRNRNDHVATHVSYKLNLKGPSITVQTACSTSLVAVHLACQSLLHNECDLALAGGASVSVPQRSGYLYQPGGVLSPDGHCRAFDENAQGTVGGNGVAIVALKRLPDAIHDRDYIHAVIRGSAINNDGSLKVGYTAPSVQGQAQVIAEAQAMAGVDIETISFIETHGTGTTLGDPIEIEALTQAFRASTDKKQFCAVGSVKTNIGHLDAAAGAAGLIKAVLALKHGMIPPSLHFERPNPQIDLANSPFYVNAQLLPWKSTSGPRRAGVSSFGIGGTNVHAVLEEAPAVDETQSSRAWQLLVLSARTSSALEIATTNLFDHLKQHRDGNLADVAYTLQVGRKGLSHRRIVVCRDIDDAVTTLETLNLKRVYTDIQEPKDRPVVFMFPGQGAQHVNMGRDLYIDEPTFRQEVDYCSEFLKPYLDVQLRDVLYPGNEDVEEATETLKQTYITQPALFVIEYALAKLLMEWGVQPQAMIGHSIGEYVAACLAGVFTLDQALELVAARGRMMQGLPRGEMLVVTLGENEVRPLLSEGVSIAAINGPSLCVVSGPEDAVNETERRIMDLGKSCRRLNTSHAFHSQMMDPIIKQFIEKVREIELRSPEIPFISNVTGTWIRAEDAIDPHYWGRHLRETVRFGEGVQELVKDPDSILLEVGPGRTLLTLTRWHPYRAPGQIVLSSLPTADDKSSCTANLLTTLGRLWLAGVKVNWRGVNAHQNPRRVPLPTYPFERQSYWVEPGKKFYDSKSGKALSSKKEDPADWFYVPSWKRSPIPIGHAEQNEQSQSSGWLVFIDECGIGAEISTRLEHAGQDVFGVIAMDRFVRLSERTYGIDPQRREDYDRLLTEISGHHKTPSKIAYLWTVTRDADMKSANTTSPQRENPDFYSLLFLAQALGAANVTDSLSLTVISNRLQQVGGKDTIDPEKATILGPCKVIPQEYRNISVSSIDIEIPSLEGHQEERLIKQLMNELAADRGDPVVAYRGDYRWTQTFEAVSLQRPKDASTGLRQEGVYLITGGLGGIGLSLGEYLAQAVQAKLVLTGRSTFPERQNWKEWLATHEDGDETSRKILKLQTLEHLGAELLILSADVTNRKQMQDVIDQTRERFGEINGVIHAAGVPAGGMIQLKSPETAAMTLASKVRGTRVLADVFKDTDLDFLALCSSRSSILGGFGQVDYCAANSFLDAFAHQQRSENARLTVTINWPGWQEVGMLANAQRDATRSEGSAQVEEVGHPLVDKCVARTPDRETFQTEFSVARHWVLDDHRNIGTAVIPGTAFLEMARAVFATQGGNEPIEIQDAYFLAPLPIRDDETKEVRIVIEKSDGSSNFRIFSKAATNNGSEPEWNEQAFGKIGYANASRARKRDLKEIQQRCNTKELILSDEHRTYEDLGPRWQSLKKVYLGEKELLAILELPDEFCGDLEKYKLHPALLDRANAAAKEYLFGRGFYLPMSYKRLTIRSPLPRKIYVHTKLKDDQFSKRQTITFDSVLMDEKGVELVEVEEFSQKRVNDITAQIKVFVSKKDQPKLHGSLGEVPKDGEPVAALNIFQKSISEGISPTEGVDAFARIVSANLSPQVVVSTRDFSSLIEEVRAATLPRLTEEIDKLQVSRPRHARPSVETPQVAPRNELEHRLAGIWQEILGIEEVGIHDDFFELGGDSIQAIQIISKINQAGLQLTPQQLFQFHTIAELAEVVGAVQTAAPEQGIVTGDVPLTPIQHWFFDQNLTEPLHFNQAILLEARQPLIATLVEEAWQYLTTHHDVLRLRYTQTGTGWTQSILNPGEKSFFRLVDLSERTPGEQDSEIRAKVAELQTGLDLNGAPLAQAVMFDLGAERNSRLLIVIHYLAVDNNSWQILLEDLQTAYLQLDRHEEIKLSNKTTSFKQWAELLAERAQTPALNQELDYWKAAARTWVPCLPVDFEGGTNIEASSRTITVSLSEGLTTALLEEVPPVYNTRTEDLLLAALIEAFSEMTNRRSLMIELESDGRKSLLEDADLSQTVGNFTSIYPMFLDLETAVGPANVLKAVKEQIRRVPNEGLGYGLLRYLSPDAEVRGFLKEADKAEVRFVYQPAITNQETVFGLTEESIGPLRSLRGKRPYLLEVRAGLTEKHLTLDYIYSENLHRESTIRALAEKFMNSLQALIQHCQSDEAGGYTPSDFPLAGLDEEKLNKLAMMIDDTD